MTQPPTKASKRGWLVGGVIAAVVIVAAVVAVVATSGGDDPADQPTPGLAQTQAVTVTGSPLTPYDRDAATDASVGEAAPTISGATFDGSPISIEPGAPTLVVFLAHWCPHCRREVPVLVDWAADGGVPSGVDVIGVATATTPDRPNYPPSNWLESEDFPFPVLADSDTYQAADAFGLTVFPYFVLLDSDGHVVARATGELDPTALTALLQTTT